MKALEMDMLVLFVVFMLETATCKKGFVKEVYSNQKLTCSSQTKKLYKVGSEMQCVHRCLHQEGCGTLNYQVGYGGKSSAHNCEIYHESHSCSLIPEMTSWKAMLFQVNNWFWAYSKKGVKLTSL